MRLAVVVAATLLFGASVAAAQPVDPYAPDAPAAPAADVELDEAVAAGLLERARVLQAEGAYADARQLVLEALARRADGPTHDAAKTLLVELNARLGIVDHPPPPPPPPPAPVESPSDVAPPPIEQLDEPAPPREAASKMRLIGSGALWGAVAGGMFADVVSGLEDTSGSDVAVGAALGALGGGLTAAALRRSDLTRGDAALIDSVALWGTEAALAFGFAIAPPETEAYTLNGTIGAAGGYLIGHIAARNREVSAGRLVKVNAVAAVGAAAPWALYALVADDSVDDDEQAFGWLSLAGLGAGIYFGFRWTSEPPPSSAVDDAPAAVVRRSSAGGWSVGGPVVAPVRTSGTSTGVAVTLLGGAW